MRQPDAPLNRDCGGRGRGLNPLMSSHFITWLLRALVVGVLMAVLFWFVKRGPWNGDGGRPA